MASGWHDWWSLAPVMPAITSHASKPVCGILLMHVDQLWYVTLQEISQAVRSDKKECGEITVVVNCLLSMAQNGPSSTLIEAECNNPRVVCFDCHEESAGEVVVLWLCPTVWKRLNEAGTV